MNILIKLTCLIGLVIAPILGGHAEEDSTTTTKVNIEKVASDVNNQDVIKALIQKMNPNARKRIIDRRVIIKTTWPNIDD